MAALRICHRTAKPKIFVIWPFTERVCCPLLCLAKPLSPPGEFVNQSTVGFYRWVENSKISTCSTKRLNCNLPKKVRAPRRSPLRGEINVKISISNRTKEKQYQCHEERQQSNCKNNRNTFWSCSLYTVLIKFVNTIC